MIWVNVQIHYLSWYCSPTQHRFDWTSCIHAVHDVCFVEMIRLPIEQHRYAMNIDELCNLSVYAVEHENGKACRNFRTLLMQFRPFIQLWEGVFWFLPSRVSDYNMFHRMKSYCFTVCCETTCCQKLNYATTCLCACRQSRTQTCMHSLPAYMYKFTRFFARFLAFLIDTPLLVLSMYQRMYLCMHLHTYQQSFAYTDTFRGKHKTYSKQCHGWNASCALCCFRSQVPNPGGKRWARRKYHQVPQEHQESVEPVALDLKSPQADIQKSKEQIKGAE